jgi:hypothetical protein
VEDTPVPVAYALPRPMCLLGGAAGSRPGQLARPVAGLSTRCLREFRQARPVAGPCTCSVPATPHTTARPAHRPAHARARTVPHQRAQWSDVLDSTLRPVAGFVPRSVPCCASDNSLSPHHRWHRTVRTTERPQPQARVRWKAVASQCVVRQCSGPVCVWPAPAARFGSCSCTFRWSPAPSQSPTSRTVSPSDA